MSRLTAVARLQSSPTGRARLRAMRDAQASVRLAIGSGALSTNVLAALADGPRTTDEVAGDLAVADRDLLPPWMRVLEGAGYVCADGAGWRLTSSGRALLEDPVLAAVHEAFPGYHTGLYRDLPDLLAGGPARHDIADNGDVIARLSQAQDAFVAELLVTVAREEAPARVLDIGCGSAGNLVTLLHAAPAASGVGVEMDAAVVESARHTVACAGLTERASVMPGELRDLVARGEVDGGFDIALYANAIYYVPLAERVAMLREIGSLLTDRGVLVVITTAAEDGMFSRHFDLELRAHRAGMELPDLDDLADQLGAAGLRPEPPRRLMPGVPLVAVLARR